MSSSSILKTSRRHLHPPSSEGSISVVPQKPGSDDRSNFTQSTTSASEWSYDSLNSRSMSMSMSISDISNRSASGRSINSSMGHIPTIHGTLMEPLNDMGSGSHHNRDSNSNNSMGGSGSFSTRDASNKSSCNSSFGESSLSSFLSVLLEDEATKPSEISIVADNAKPEQRSIRDLRLSFIRTAYKNDKPKCRWEYLTRDNNDREQLARSRKRSGLETRSESFSGPINETKQKIRFPSSNSNSNMNNSKNSSSNKNNSVEGLFLRMPVRKNSPMSEAAKKKSLMSRVNMSDTDLVLLPMQPGTSCAGFSPTKGKRSKRRPRHCQHGGSFSGEPGHHSHNSYSRNSHSKVGLSRSGCHKESIGNATWSKADTMRDRRSINSNQFLDFLFEPESKANENSASWPSPLPSPAVPSDSHFALGISQRQLQLANLSSLSLGESSDEEGENKNKIKMNKAEKKITKSPPPRPSSFSKKNGMKQPRRSSDSSIKSSRRKHKDNSHKRNSSSSSSVGTTTTKTRSPEICSSEPPQIPTRCSTPKSPRGTMRKKKPQSLSVLPNMPPISPKSPLNKTPPSSRQRKKRSSVSAVPNFPPLTPKSSRSTTERRKSSPNFTTLSSRTSTTQTQRKKKASMSNLLDFSALSPKSPRHPKPPKGKWFSPFDYNP